MPIDTLTLDPENARVHGDKNLDAIKESLTEFGQLKPVVVHRRTMTVVAGNGTLMAALALGWDRLAANIVDHLSDAQAKAYAITDNRTTDLSEFNWDRVGAHVKELHQVPIDMGRFGWDPKELESLLTVPGQVPDPPVPMVLPKPVTEHGDTWLLGRHRLMCGSATDPASMDRLTKGRKAKIVFTDPPYGVEVVGGSRMLSTKERLAKGGKTIQGDAMDLPRLRKLLIDSLGLALEHCEAGAPWYVCSPGGVNTTTFGEVMAELKISRHLIIWVKDRFVISRGDFHYRHEILYYGWKPGAAHVAPAERDLDTVWEIPRPARSEEHPTIKPVALVAKALTISSAPGDLALDVFGGSGTTLIAAHDLKRDCFMMELDPRYVDVIIRRWQAATGQAATLESTGSGIPHRDPSDTWAMVARERGVDIKEPEAAPQ